MSDKKIVLYNFLLPDYKAIEQYFNDMQDRGYELVRTMPVNLAVLKKSEDKNIRYFVDALKNGVDEDYLALLKDSGWEPVGKVPVRGGLVIFKSSPGVTPVPIQTDDEIEAKNIFNCCLKREMMGLLFPLFYYIFLCWQYIFNFSYDVIVRNTSLILLFIAPGFTVYVLWYITYLTAYAVRSRARIREGQALLVPSVRTARLRGNAVFGCLFLGLLLILAALVFDMFSMGGFALGVLIPILAAAAIGIGISQSRLFFKRSKGGKILIMVVCVLLLSGFTSYVISYFVMNQVMGNRETWQQREERAANMQVIRYEDFFEKAEEERLYSSLEEASSFLVPVQQHSTVSLKGNFIRTDYYKAANAWAADVLFDGLYAKYLQKEAYDYIINESPYSGVEIYYNEWRDCVLIRKGNVIALVETSADFNDAKIWSIIIERLKLGD